MEGDQKVQKMRFIDVSKEKKPIQLTFFILSLGTLFNIPYKNLGFHLSFNNLVIETSRSRCRTNFVEDNEGIS